MKLNIFFAPIKNTAIYSTWFFLNLSAVSALAQTVPDAGDLERQAEQTPTEPLPTLPPTDTPPPADTSGVNVQLREFLIKGNTLIGDDELQALLAPWKNRPLGMPQLKRITANISEYYQQRGYLVRVLLPQQDINKGELKIVIVEARFGEAKVEFSAPPQRSEKSLISKTLEKQQSRGQFLRLEKLERATLLLKDMPGIDVKSTLVPGQQNGETDVVVTATETPVVGGSVTLDNLGVRSTGEWRVSPTLRLMNPSGAGDDATFSTMFSEGNSYGRASYRRPLNNDGLYGGVNVSYLGYSLGGDFDALEAEGTASSFGLEGSYAWIRRQKQSLWLNSSLTHKSYDNRQLGQSVSDKVIDALQIGVSGNFSDTRWTAGVNYYSANITFGSLDLSGNAVNEAQDKASAETAGSYSVLHFQMARLQRLRDDLGLWVSLRGQFASKNLDSSESMSGGGPGGVRAYPVLEGRGDSGLLLTIEGRYRVRNNLTVIPLLDFASLTDKATKLESSQTNNFTGLGIGADWSLPGNYSLRGSISHRIGDNPLADPVTGYDSDGRKTEWPIWITISKFF